MSLTAEQLAQFKSTYGNKLWRLTNLYKIRDKKRRLRRFDAINTIQAGIVRVLEDFIRERKPIRAFFLKFRQGGVSTLLLLWWLDDAIFTPNTINGVLSHKHDSLQELARIIKTGYEHMPAGLQPPLLVDNIASLEFGHGKRREAGKYEATSRIFTSLDIRSTPVHNLHISEWCHAEDAKIAASIAAVPPDGNITGETTANGMGNDGYLTYQDGKAGVGEFRAAFFPWFIQREYRLPVPAGAFIRRTSEEVAVAKRALLEYGVTLDDGQVLYRRKLVREQKDLRPQEFPENDEEAFLSSGHLFFNSKKVLTMMREARAWAKDHPPVEETDDYIVYVPPKKGHVYVAGADVAGDEEGDYSVLKIIDVTEQAEVFVYRARISPQRFYRVIDKWGRAYNNALMGVEKNNHGHAVIMGLDETCRYRNLFAETKTKRPRVAIITGTKSTAKEERKFGWVTDSASRPLMLDQLRLAVEGEVDEDVENFEPMWHVRDLALCGELLTFTEQDGKYQAAPGKHDDIIFATAIAHQMFLRLQRYVTPEQQTQVTRSDPRTYRVESQSAATDI